MGRSSSRIFRHFRSVQNLWQAKQTPFLRNSHASAVGQWQIGKQGRMTRSVGVCQAAKMFSSSSRCAWDDNDTWLVANTVEDSNDLMMFNIRQGVWETKEMPPQHLAGPWRISGVDGGLLLVESVHDEDAIGGLQVLNPLTMQSYNLPDFILEPGGFSHSEPWGGSLYDGMDKKMHGYDVGFRYDSVSNTYKVIVLRLHLSKPKYFLVCEYNSAQGSWKARFLDVKPIPWDFEVQHTFLCKKAFYCFNGNYGKSAISCEERMPPLYEEVYVPPSWHRSYGKILGYKDGRIMSVSVNFFFDDGVPSIVVYEFHKRRRRWKVVYSTANHKNDDEEENDLTNFVVSCARSFFPVRLRGSNCIWIVNEKSGTAMSIDVDASQHKFWCEPHDHQLIHALKGTNSSMQSSLSASPFGNAASVVK